MFPSRPAPSLRCSAASAQNWSAQNWSWPGPAKCRRQIGLVPSLQSQTSLQGFYLFDMSYVMTHTNSVTRNNKRSASVPSSGPADARHTPVMLQSVAAASAAPSCSLA